MFKSDKPLPPPPSSRPRNESLGSHLPSFRSRPAPNGNDSESTGFSFSSTKSLFESLNKPQVRSAISSVAKNPTVQRTAVAVAKDERVRNAAINEAKKPENQATAVSFAQTPSGRNAISSLAKQFESKPLMGVKPSKEQPFVQEEVQRKPWNGPTIPPPVSHHTREQIYPSLTGDGSHNRNARIAAGISTGYSQGYQERPRSTEPEISTILDELFPVNSSTKSPAPARPPPPKLGSRSIPNISGIGGPGYDSNVTDPHGVAKYPYKTDKYDEVSCESGDTILLKKEIDEHWIYGTNTRTGHSGILPISFLHIKIPLAPTATATHNHSYMSPELLSPTWMNDHDVSSVSYGSSGSGMSHSFSSQSSSLNFGRHIARALYDYETGVHGDLNFKAGEIIYVTERVDDEWLRGDSNYESGIFPVNYVDLPDLDQVPRKGKTGNALVDSFSKLSFKIRFVTALYNYCSGVPEDLVFEAGDVIQILEDINDEWIKGQLDGRIGLVPLTYVERNE